MEKFFVIDIAGHPAGIIEAENETEAVQKVEPHDIVIGVDDAMTLAENLVKFIGQYRYDVLTKKYGKAGLSLSGYIKHVCDDILVNTSR
jgi:hypothetical protein